MSIIRAFRAVRPKQEYAAQVAALPYDVMNSAEAREKVKGNPLSFIHVDKAEVDLPGASASRRTRRSSISTASSGTASPRPAWWAAPPWTTI